MALTAQQRKDVWAQFMSDTSNDEEKFGAFNKNELRAAVDAVAARVTANTAGMRAAIPSQVRNGLTVKQQARLYMAIAIKEYEVS